jgi:hypothetical protein
MLTPKFLEGMNGALFIELTFALIMFGLYIGRETLRNGFVRARLQAAISIFVVLAGEAMIRGWVWWWRHLENAGQSSAWMSHHPVLLIGASVEMLGVVCIIRVFAPDDWSRSAWFTSAVAAITIATALAYL